ncbi:glycosyltransferase family 4 protein [Tropicimonas aquimaris]|uniref:Glycosyltransferase family 4 protein n=1 Tax=Tropicimonas aquimaris TaxID=914152 RepID=A0ABW3ILC5_9RHOB
MTGQSRRVLFPFSGETVGGSHVSALTLVGGLADTGWEPVVGVHQPGGLLSDYLDTLGQPWIALPDLALPTMGSLRRQAPVFARATWPLCSLLRAQGIGIVHTNDIRMHQLWGLPARLAGATHLWHQRTPTRNRRLDAYARLATRVATVSDYCRGELPPRLRGKAVVVTNPVILPEPPDRAAARTRLLEALGRPDAGPVIGFVSNITERKRPLAMVALASALRAAGHADAVFPMFGDARPPTGPELDAAISGAGLQGTVVPMGPRFPIEPWLAGCDILIAPARREAFGRTLVEAMLCGTAVIASDEGGHREIVDHGRTGLLVPPDDPPALEAAARQLLADPATMHGIAEAARSEAEARYGLPAHVAAITALYARG